MQGSEFGLYGLGCLFRDSGFRVWVEIGLCGRDRDLGEFEELQEPRRKPHLLAQRFSALPSVSCPLMP